MVDLLPGFFHLLFYGEKREEWTTQGHSCAGNISNSCWKVALGRQSSLTTLGLASSPSSETLLFHQPADQKPLMREMDPRVVIQGGTIHPDPDPSSSSPPLPIRKLIWVDVTCVTCCSGRYFEGASELGELGQGSGGGRRQLRFPSKYVLSGVRGKAETYCWIFFWRETCHSPLGIDPNNFTRSVLMDSFWVVLLSWVWGERTKLLGKFDASNCVI